MSYGEIDHEARANRLQAKLNEMESAAEMLWVVLANVSGGDWKQQGEEWQDVAAKWRDNYFKAKENLIKP